MAVIAYACRGCDMNPRPRKWRGPCPGCGGFWSIVQRHVSSEDVPEGVHVEAEDGELVSLCDVAEDAEEDPRIEIGGKFKSVDFVLGGGVVGCSMTLLSGKPGIGKSTLLLQMLQQLAKKKLDVIYVSGEESIKQVALRSKKLGRFNQRLRIVKENDLDAIQDILEEARPDVAVVDSAQSLICVSPVTDEELEAGSTKAVSVAVKTLYQFAQKKEIAVILVGHVTKDGAIAGPNSFQHDVDTVLYFDGRQREKTRTLSSSKNRFGSVGPEIYAAFEMTDKGLVPVEVVEEEEPDPPSKSKTPSVSLPPPPTPTPAPASAPATIPSPPSSVAPKKPTLKSIPLSAADTAALAIACDVPECRGSIGRACSSSSGVREAGFHQERLRKAKLQESSVQHPEDLKEPTAPDPFAKKFGAPPRARPKKSKAKAKTAHPLSPKGKKR